MSNALKRYINTIPKAFNPETNTVMAALLYSIALSDDDVENSITEARKQLFVRTATGSNLDRLAKSLGVARPATLGLTDEEYQNLIPNLSLKPKTIRKSFYDTADVFWGPLFSRANVMSKNFAPFDVLTGDVIKVKIDNLPIQSVKVLAGDIAVNGSATAEEIQAILSKIKNTTTIINEDSLTGNKFINVRTNTPGPTGTVQILDSSMLSNSKLDLTLGSYNILDLDQRVAVYNINPNELLIEIPSIVPALRRTLRGSHHFHTDSTLEAPRDTAQGIWAGSFLFNPSGSEESVTITKQKCALQQTLSKGSVYTSIAIDDNTSFLATSGQLLFSFGRDNQEGPVRYRGIPNSSTILLDPSYTFKNDHAIGDNVNVISKQEPYVPLKTGKDLAIYLTSPSGAREVVQLILEALAAAGITITFKVLSPKYKYLIDSPYVSSDDAPSEN